MKVYGIIKSDEGNIFETMRGFFEKLFEEEVIDYLLVPQHISKGRTLTQTLVKNIENLDGINPFSYIEVRKAIYHSINIDEIIDEHLYGFGTSISQYVSPLIYGYNPEIERLKFDLETAKDLMKKVGLKEGINVTLDCPDDNLMKNISSDISEQLKEIKFAYSCVETCLLPVELNSSSYNLMIEIDSGKLEIDKIIYTLKKEESVDVEINVEDSQRKLEKYDLELENIETKKITKKTKIGERGLLGTTIEPNVEVKKESTT